jgi:hypothetical protein
MPSFGELRAKPAVAGGLAGGLVSALLVAVGPSVVSGVWNYATFSRNIALEAIKSSKNAADVKSVIDLLCERKFITDKEHCPN